MSATDGQPQEGQTWERATAAIEARRLEPGARGGAKSGATSPDRRAGTNATSARADPTLWAATIREPATLSGSPRPSTTIAGARVRMISSGALHPTTIPTSIAMTHG